MKARSVFRNFFASSFASPTTALPVAWANCSAISRNGSFCFREHHSRRSLTIFCVILGTVSGECFPKRDFARRCQAVQDIFHLKLDFLVITAFASVALYF